MNSEDDTFFEEDDEDATFPDEDIADEDQEEEAEDEDFEDDTDFEVRSYEQDSGGWFPKFISEPWPMTVFIITVIGLGIVLLTPPTIWALNHYSILGVFFLIVAALVGIVFSLVTWSRAGTHRLKWAGPANIIVILLATGVGVYDTIIWILTGAGMIPAIDTPLILLCFMLVFFSLYTLWMIQRSLDPEPR